MNESLQYPAYNQIGDQNFNRDLYNLPDHGSISSFMAIALRSSPEIITAY